MQYCLKFFLKAKIISYAQRVEKISLCETDSPDTAEVALAPEGGAVSRRGGGREPCHSSKYFGQTHSSLPPQPAGGALRARVPLSLARHLPTPWGVTLAEGAKG